MRIFMCWIVFLSSSIPVLAEDISTSITPAMVITANQLMDSAQHTNKAYAIVDSLTTEVGPRLAGTEAEARARQWAVEKMTSLGLKNIRVEIFEVPLWLRGEESAK